MNERLGLGWADGGVHGGRVLAEKEGVYGPVRLENLEKRGEEVT